MKMSEVKPGMKLRDARDSAAPDIRVTMLTERGFQYLYDRPLMVKLGEYDYGQCMGGEHFGVNGESLFTPVPPPPPPPPVNHENVALTSGEKVPPDRSHTALRPNGQQQDYIVLTEEERKKGFVRPVRSSYRHVGIPAPVNPLRDLTAEEHARYDQFGYVKYEEYPEGSEGACGKYWTQKELDKIGKGCGHVTSMGRALAETYARDPGFYGGTFCHGCSVHLPVGPHGEFVWTDDGERVGT